MATAYIIHTYKSRSSCMPNVQCVEVHYILCHWLENGSNSKSAPLRSPSLSSLIRNTSMFYLESHSDDNMSDLTL